MITHLEDILDDLEKNQNIITYLKSMYKEKTGLDPVIPEGEALYMKMNNPEEKDQFPNQRYRSFKDKIAELNLPSPLDKNAKNRIEKLRRMKDTKVLIQKLDLSYFAEKDINQDLLRKVIEGMKILKSVQMIDLSHNNLDDSYIGIICDFFQIPGLHQIDISFNNLTKACIKRFIATVKTAKTLTYLDVSYNPFNNDEYSCLVLSTAVKGCERLQHFGMNDCSRDSAIRVLATRPGVMSLNIEDCRYKKKTWDTVSRYLTNKKYLLSVLSLKYATIDFVFGAQFLSKGLRLNRTLISLNLYSTGLCDMSGALIIRAVQNHKILKELNLGENKLAMEFCVAFGQVLKKNKVLEYVNIGKNVRIVNDNYRYVLEGLVENQMIKRLGDLMDTKIGVKYREITEKLLALNSDMNDSKEVDLLKSQKTDFFKSSMCFDINNKEENLNRSTESITGDCIIDEDNEREMIDKYKLAFYDDNTYITQDMYNNEMV